MTVRPLRQETPEVESGPGRSRPEVAAATLAEEFALTAAAHDASGAFPFRNFQRLSETGLLALAVPRSLGGLDGRLSDVVAVLREIGRGEPSTALVLAMHYIHHASMRGRWPEAIVDRLGREAAAGGGLINALRVEPELGTPSRGGLPATIARRSADGWRLTGHKIYSTGVPILSWYAVWARTDAPEPAVGTFLVAAGAPGIRIVETWNHLGLRASGSHDVIFEDVAVPFDHAVELQAPDAWKHTDPGLLAWHALAVSAIYDGIAGAAQAWLLDFLKRRIPSNLGAPLASLPRFQEAVGEIEALLAVNRRLLTNAAADVDRGSPPSQVESGLLKSVVTGNAISAVEIAVKLTGNPGISRANPLERHYRDVLCGRVHTPQDDSARVAAGRAALGV
jgi:alkylation response protein AidB-like acyl-CoA dehydrogenase